MDVTDLVFMLLVLPLGGAACLFCLRAFSGKNSTLDLGLGLGALLLTWIPLILLFPSVSKGGSISGVIGGWGGSIGIEYRFDFLAWILDALCLVVTIPAYIYFKADGRSSPGHSILFLLLVAATLAAAMTGDIFNLFVCMEVIGLSSYVLVSFSDKPGALLASFTYLVLSSTAMLFFLLGTWGIYRVTGSLSYSEIASALSKLPATADKSLFVAFAFIIAAIAVRVAVLPVYGWLPDAHALAPHGISAILSAVLIKTPLFALYRIVILVPFSAQTGELFIWVGACTALTGVLVALSQKDSKQLLAYHSVSQIGYVVTAWGAALVSYPSAKNSSTPVLAAALTASCLYALYHALFKGLLFLSVGSTIEATGQRTIAEMHDASRQLGISGDRFKISRACFMIGSLSIAAIPPLTGFAGKAAVGYAIKGHPAYTILIIASIGTVASFIKLSSIYIPAFRIKRSNYSPELAGRPGSGLEQAESAAHTLTGSGIGSGGLKHPLPITIGHTIAQAILAFACIFLGIAAPQVSRIVSEGLSGIPGKSIPGQLYTASSLITSLAVSIGGYFVYRLLMTDPVQKLATLIRDRKRDFGGLFLALAAATTGLAVFFLLTA